MLCNASLNPKLFAYIFFLRTSGLPGAVFGVRLNLDVLLVK